MINASEVIREALSWEGTPVVASGSVKGHGCNCLGLWAGIAKECGLNALWEAFKPWQGQKLPPSRTFLLRSLRTHLTKTSDLVAPCLILVRTPGLDFPSHVAGYIGNDEIIEASHRVSCEFKVGKNKLNPRRLGMVIKTRLDPDLKIIERYKIPGVDYGA